MMTFMLLIGTDAATELSLLRNYARKNRKAGKKNTVAFNTPASVYPSDSMLLHVSLSHPHCARKTELLVLKS